MQMKGIAATDYDDEDVGRSTTHTYRELTDFRGADDAPLKLNMDSGKEDARLRLMRSDTAET